MLLERAFGVKPTATMPPIHIRRRSTLVPDARTRFRCSQCGNLTRFDVVETRRTRSFHHFTLGGELRVEEEEVLSSERERVTCRWCGSSESIEEVPVEEGGA
jgi:DNA-directed RNA polymerase subunit M/transcription elongation factor TFIIS